MRGYTAAFFNVTETTESSLVNMQLESRDIMVKLTSTGITCSQSQPSFKVMVMTSRCPLKQGDKLYVKRWRPDPIEKRKADDELDGVPMVKKPSKGKGGKKGKSSN